MKPRILNRTHYQVDEPAYLEILIKHCTSPTQSDYPENAARKLEGAITKRGRKFNVAAAGYAVDLARGMGLISDSAIWTEKGHLVALASTVGAGNIDSETELNEAERLLHFRLFLESDGAAFLHIAKKLLDVPHLPSPGNDWNSFATELFLGVYQDYLAVTEDTADRLSLRRDLDRLRVSPFSGKTGPHKCFLHLQTLYRLGLLRRDETASQREYELDDFSSVALRELVRTVPNVRTLDLIFREGRWPEIATSVFQIAFTSHADEKLIFGTMLEAYREMLGTGVPLCSLSTLHDIVQIRLLRSHLKPMKQGEMMELLQARQKERPRDIRFHVDRQGRPAFVKLSDSFLAA